MSLSKFFVFQIILQPKTIAFVPHRIHTNRKSTNHIIAFLKQRLHVPPIINVLEFMNITMIKRLKFTYVKTDLQRLTTIVLSFTERLRPMRKEVRNVFY